MLAVFMLAFIIGPILLACLLAYGWRRKALQSAEAAQGMALYAARLEGQFSESQRHNEHYRELAREAIREGAKATKLNPDSVLPRRTDLPSLDMPIPTRYVAPVVAFCPACNVSVRHDPAEYPVHCPACQTLIDPTFDSPPEL